MKIQKLTFPLAVSIALIAGPMAGAQSVTNTTNTTTTATTTTGLVSEMGPDALLIRTTTSTVPIRYYSTGTTIFEDETGAPVAREVVASGLPVTVEYSRDGDRLLASRVVVHRKTVTTETAPTVIEKTTTINRPPVIVDRPVIVEKKVPVDRPVIVEKKVYVDRPVIVEKKVPVDRPVIVEKPVPAPVIEEKKTTTTTTTTNSKKEKD